jgi:5'-3' exonuclease
LGAVRDFLVRKWGATVLTDAYEVDDRLGIEAADNTVICAIDKDLRQIPGEHYNPTKDVFEVVDPQAAAIALYTSMVVGDAADNLRGIDGLGPVKAGRLLRACSAEEAHSVVSGLYQERDQDFFLAYRLFRLLRSTEEYWEIMNEIAVSQGEGPEATTDSEGHAIGGVTGVILQ